MPVRTVPLRPLSVICLDGVRVAWEPYRVTAVAAHRPLARSHSFVLFMLYFHSVSVHSGGDDDRQTAEGCDSKVCAARPYRQTVCSRDAGVFPPLPQPRKKMNRTPAETQRGKNPRHRHRQVALESSKWNTQWRDGTMSRQWERDLKDLEHIRIEFQIPLDEDRYLDRRCPWSECGADFKVQFDDWGAKIHNGMAYCRPRLRGLRLPVRRDWRGLFLPGLRAQLRRPGL